MAKVYHDKQFPALEVQDRTFPDDFVEVAKCDSDDPGEIFRLTNHIDKLWWLNDGVTISNGTCGMNKMRSTSIGDVFMLSSGLVLVCRNTGWSIIGNFSDEPIMFTTGFGIPGSDLKQT